MDKLRLCFSKTGRAVYISHLDLMHTFQRAFSRAGYDLKYSEGFNPHPVISIAMPLSVGTSSECELMDFRLNQAADLTAMASRLTDALPDGIRVHEVYEADRKITELKWLEAVGTLRYDNGADVGKLRAFFSQDTIFITKKTKRGTGDVDIVPGIRTIEADGSDDGRIVTLRAVVSAQEPVLNPELLVEALRQNSPDLAPVFASFNRVEIYDAEMRRFR